MKASKLITDLQSLIDKHGDLPVNFDGGSDIDASVFLVIAYDEAGNNPTDIMPAVEFYLHQGAIPSRRSSPSIPS